MTSPEGLPQSQPSHALRSAENFAKGGVVKPEVTPPLSLEQIAEQIPNWLNTLKPLEEKLKQDQTLNIEEYANWEKVWLEIPGVTDAEIVYKRLQDVRQQAASIRDVHFRLEEHRYLQDLRVRFWRLDRQLQQKSLSPQERSSMENDIDHISAEIRGLEQ